MQSGVIGAKIVENYFRTVKPGDLGGFRGKSGENVITLRGRIEEFGQPPMNPDRWVI
jgi:hypothetical protein